jgi:hypothetical protein
LSISNCAPSGEFACAALCLFSLSFLAATLVVATSLIAPTPCGEGAAS